MDLPLTPTQRDVLRQMITPVWDGNLISKSGRTEVVRMGLASCYEGINFLTTKGYSILKDLGELEDSDKMIGGKYWKRKIGWI